MKQQQSLDIYAKIVWDYLQMHQPLEKADVIIGFGSHDKRTAEWAARLYLDGYAPLVIFCGNEGVGKDVSGFNGKSEAAIYKDIAMAAGVPEKAIITETKSTNSSENVRFVAQLIAERNLKVKTALIAHKPYMERRAYATIKAQWPQPQPKIIMTSVPISYEEYISDPNYSRDFTLNTMVGDLQRIKVYPKLGYQIEQDIPSKVWEAFNNLVSLGFDKHLIESRL